MKARIPTRVSNKQMAAIRQEVAKELTRQEQGYARRLFKLFCASLHQEYGFGKKRCMRAMNMANALAEEHEHDEVFWHHIDTLVIDQLGLEFSRENYEEVDR